MWSQQLPDPVGRDHQLDGAVSWPRFQVRLTT